MTSSMEQNWAHGSTRARGSTLNAKKFRMFGDDSPLPTWCSIENSCQNSSSGLSVLSRSGLGMGGGYTLTATSQLPYSPLKTVSEGAGLRIVLLSSTLTLSMSAEMNRASCSPAGFARSGIRSLAKKVLS